MKNAGFAAVLHFGGVLGAKLLLWLQLVCVETVNGSTRPIPKRCRGCGEERAGRLPLGSPRATQLLGWGRRKPARAGELSGGRGEGLFPMPASGEVGDDPDPGIDRRPEVAAKSCKGQGGAVAASPPAPANSRSAVIAET